MKVSVVMTSYNGEKYIYEQIQSIYEQTTPPDEVIIADDCSQDKTAIIIENFIIENNLKNWKLIINARNKGWKQNFLDALAKAHGDYIFFSDHDDVWYKNKIETMTALMEQHSNIHCLVGKITFMDDRGTMFHGENPLNAENSSGNLTNRKFSANFNTVIMPGCSMCITRQLADMIIQISVKNVDYDTQCCRLGVLLDGTFILEKPVIYHRLHNHNTTNFDAEIKFGSFNRQERVNNIKNNIIWLEKLLKTTNICQLLDKEKKSVIENTILFQNERLEFLSHKNLMGFIRLFKYKKYYSGISMYLGDFCYAFHINRLAGHIRRYIRPFHRARRM